MTTERGTTAERSVVRVLRTTSPFLRLASVVLRGVFGATARIRYEGPASLPQEGPLLLVANHTSNIDPPLVAAWLQPRLGRPIQFLAKEQLFVPLLLPLLEHAGAILVRAGGSDVQAYHDALVVLRGGGIVGLFPEGTRSSDGRLGQPHAGVGLLAIRAGVPILPVGISGAQRFLPRNGRLPAIGTRITIRVGEPFTVGGAGEGSGPSPVADAARAGTAATSGARPRRQLAEAATTEIMTRLAALLDPGQRGAWGGTSGPGATHVRT
ncbi:MAG TPA: lysophospholipid acyltransferase family protein [Candidatus Sulfotelmatobacter sp.]|nr:lysophospholipid acyltransferase family protein [Candidatus Sulfotelmatobacter sp.]